MEFAYGGKLNASSPERPLTLLSALKLSWSQATTMMCPASLPQTLGMLPSQVGRVQPVLAHPVLMTASQLTCRALCLDKPHSPTRSVPVVVFRESVVIGETSMSSDEVNQMVTDMGLEFKGSAYHLLQRNCNHFSDAIITRLCGRHPPSWVSCGSRSLHAFVSHAPTSSQCFRTRMVCT